jgi:hypothetical protein
VGTANWFLTFCLFIEAPLLVASGASGGGGLPESLRLSSFLNVSLVGTTQETYVEAAPSREFALARTTPHTWRTFTEASSTPHPLFPLAPRPL